MTHILDYMGNLHCPDCGKVVELPEKLGKWFACDRCANWLCSKECAEKHRCLRVVSR